MKLPKKLKYSILVFLFVLITASIIYIFVSKVSNIQINLVLPDKGIKTNGVAKVIDGDTIALENGEKVRYIGINTPEYNQCYGLQATNLNKQIIGKNQLVFVKDTSETDKYNRLLRYVYVKGCSDIKIIDKSFCEQDDTLFLNKYLIANGYATLMQIPPDTKYYDQFKDLEQAAKENNLGLWEDCR